MTNAEKYKTPEERSKAFDAYCMATSCDECPCQIVPASCEYAWLDLEAKAIEAPKQEPAT